jgi:cytochrome c oxidase assembly factor CtaG
VSAALAAAPVLVWVGVAGFAYERGRRRLRRRFPARRGPTGAQQSSFWLGLAVVVVALASPLDRAADELFALHMVQHLSLALLAPLLLVVAEPVPVMARALPEPTRHEALRLRARVVATAHVDTRSPMTGFVVVTVQVLVLLAWHVPGAYDAAVATPWLHVIEHASLFVVGVAFWWIVLRPGRKPAGVGIIYLFVSGLAMGALAALLTLAPQPLYASHLATTAAWGLTPLTDQQLAGAVMWVPGGCIHLVVAAVLVVRWLGSGPVTGESRLVWRP